MITLFAGIHGYLDDLEIEQVREFEAAIHHHLEGPGRALSRALLEKKKFDDDLTAQVKSMLEALKIDFQAKHAAA